jgi:twitching motility protein PilT
MQTFNQGLATLYHRRIISLQTALSYSSYPDELQDMINRGVGAVSPNPEPRRAGRS